MYYYKQYPDKWLTATSAVTETDRMEMLMDFGSDYCRYLLPLGLALVVRVWWTLARLDELSTLEAVVAAPLLVLVCPCRLPLFLILFTTGFFTLPNGWRVGRKIKLHIIETVCNKKKKICVFLCCEPYFLETEAEPPPLSLYSFFALS